MPLDPRIAKVLQSLIGDTPQQEGVQPTSSPLDFVPYAGLASGAARGLAGLAQRQALQKLAGNEIGSLGSQIASKAGGIVPRAMTAEEGAALNPALAKFKITGQTSPEIEQASQAGEAALSKQAATEEAGAQRMDALRKQGIDPLRELYPEASAKEAAEGASASEETIPTFDELKKKLQNIKSSSSSSSSSGVASQLHPDAKNANLFDKIIEQRASNEIPTIEHLKGTNVNYKTIPFKIKDIGVKDQFGNTPIRLENNFGQGMTPNLSDVLDSGIPLDSKYNPLFKVGK